MVIFFSSLVSIVDGHILHLTIVNSGVMTSDHHISQLNWFLQGHTFSYNARVLPLKCFDMILGVNWLEDHSPMWIHWKKKIMRFPHHNRRIQLNGVRDSQKPCTFISPRKLKGLLKRNAASQGVLLHPITRPSEPTVQPLWALSLPEDIPVAVQHFLQWYEFLFREPTSLPPTRDCDHSIPLLPGA